MSTSAEARAEDAGRGLPPRYRAMACTAEAPHRLLPVTLPMPALAPGQIRLQVRVCGVCRTDLHIVDGELPLAAWPRVPGHEIVGRVVECGPGVANHRVGDRVGVPWLHAACGRCRRCAEGHENLCEQAVFTGWTVDGGYAQYAVAQADYSFALPDRYSDEEAAPLLCAGLIGYRALGMVPQARTLGLYGFGAAAHLIAQVAVAQGRRVFAFTRPGDAAAQDLARSLGVDWAGDSTQAPPAPMDAALLFAPAGDLVPQALQWLEPAGTVVCAGIHMSDIPGFPYRWLWQERCIRSVANLTRADAIGFLEWAAAHPLKLSTTAYALAQAGAALDDLRAGRIVGAAVLDCGTPL